MNLAPPDCLSFLSTSTLVVHRNSPSRTRTRTSRLCCRASLITSPDSFQVGRMIGSYGFMNVTSYSGFPSALDDVIPASDFGQLRVQDVGEGSVKIRLYEGRVSQGLLRGTPVIFKVYPGQRAGGSEADMMAANELNAHIFLQSSSSGICDNLSIIIGGFETTTGEQWLAFRNDGKSSASDYAKKASEKTLSRYAVRETWWNPYEEEQRIRRRRKFIVKLFQGAMKGLAFMHNHDRLHQSLGPSSIVLNTVAEREAVYLIPRLRDLAFSVDIRFSSLEEAPTSSLSEGLWRRASSCGAFTPMEKKAFGIADDIYEAGLLFAFLAFIPFCEAGVIDGLSLQRLLENTFKLDIEAVREYCLADDKLLEAVMFLDCGDRAGWELLKAMLNPNFRERPVAEAVLSHPFIKETVF